MELVHLNDANFKEETKEGIVVVDFFATWCGPCKILGPIMEDVQKELSNVKIFKVDVDENEQTARDFGIMSIPTIVVLKDGVEIDRHVGLMNRDSLVEWISEKWFRSQLILCYLINFIELKLSLLKRLFYFIKLILYSILTI